jgi:hypothetical protein
MSIMLKKALILWINMGCIRKHQQKKRKLKQEKLKRRKDWAAYFSGTYIDDRDAPIPGVPCLTGLLVIANSPR